MCRSRYPNSFIIVSNHPLQRSKEIIKKAQEDYRSFCNNFSEHNLLNSTIDDKEQKILADHFCHVSTQKQTKLHYGDIVLKGTKLYQYTAKGDLPYLEKVKDGLVVYRINPPLSLYIYNDGKLALAHNGDKVIKDDKAYIVKNNQLVKFN